VRLFSPDGAAAVDDGGRHYDGAEPPDGGGGTMFEFPDDVGARLHGFAVRGRPLWETDVERQHRLTAEEMARRQDPATLLAAVEQIVLAGQAAAEAKPAPTAKTPAKAAVK
jgi:hypothetical protein